MRMLVLLVQCLLSAPVFSNSNLNVHLPTVQQIAAPLELSGFSLSPDGKHLLAISHTGNTRNILVWDTGQLQKPPTAIGAQRMQIASAFFVKNDVIGVDMVQPYDARLDEVTKTFVRKLFLTDLKGEKWTEPLANQGTSRTDLQSRLNELARPSVLARMPDDPDHILVMSDGLGRARDVYRYNLRTQDATRVMRLSDRDVGVYVDRAGVPYARSRSGSDSKGLFIALDFRNQERNDWEEHFKSYVKDREIKQVVWASSSARRAILQTNQDSEHTRLVEYDVARRTITETLFRHEFFDSERIIGVWDSVEKRQRVIGFGYAGPTGSEVYWVDQQVEALVSGLKSALAIKLKEVDLLSFNGGKRSRSQVTDGASLEVLDYRTEGPVRALLKVEGPNHPPDFYLLMGNQLRLLTKGKAQVDRRALGSSSFVYFPARDGSFLPAFLTLPNRELCGNGPYQSVIHPHGGPWARDYQDYDRSGWIPLMVTRCIAVLQPQFRGSANWGRSLWMAGDAEWGQKMQDDKDDGARWLIQNGIADPKRLAMFGFSYGGYAAYVAAIRPSELYQCAIAGAGVSDLESIGSAFFSNPYFRVAQEPTMRGLNPMKKVSDVSIPLLVYHGDRDQTVPLSQSTSFVSSARKLGKPVEYRELEDFGHGNFWNSATQVEHLQIIHDFLKGPCLSN